MKIYGRHAAFEALNNPKREIIEIFVDRLDILSSQPVAKKYRVTVIDIDKKFPQFQNHQGIVITTKPLPIPALESLTGAVLILDQITDPQNLGAIIRSAAVFGIEAIITQDFQGLMDSSVMARIASGGLEHVALIPVVNISRALETLKESNYWIYGLSVDGKETLQQTQFAERSALVIGAEGKGIRSLVSKTCDFLLTIKTSPKFSVLNASHAASVSMYELMKGKK